MIHSLYSHRIDTTLFDAAEYLDCPEALAGYLNEAFATGDAVDIAEAIATAARIIRTGIRPADRL
jgi:DNA-binding phage protein